jgi:cobalt-precorrin-5B (C1)-methyltransferase
MTNIAPRAGYTLPVFACAVAIAALRHLQNPQLALPTVAVDLIDPPETAEIAIEQVACLSSNAALAITRSDPGDNLDLTRHTPVWAVVTWGAIDQSEAIVLEGGAGIGRQINADNQPAIYAYAQRLCQTNLLRWLQPDQQILVTLILPEGRALAERTSNAAFGVVEGLSLLGTSGIAQPLSAPGQLEIFRQSLQQQRAWYDGLVFCVGENGLDLAKSLGVNPDRLVKTGNWLGPLLVEAGLQGVQSILLFGYHGKLIKLAGGIFHTHHHVADGRQEIFTAHCAKMGLPTEWLPTLFSCSTLEAALQQLRHWDATTGSDWVVTVYDSIVQQIDQRAQTYIHTHSQQSLKIGSILFDRDRKIIVQSEMGQALLSQIGKAR